MTNTAKTWDTAALQPLTAGQHVLRAIDESDIKGWNESEQRWDLMPSAIDTQRLTPGEESGYGLSVFVEEYLAARCGAAPGRELVLLQAHAAQHGCPPTWQDGIVVKVDVADLLALRFGVGESADDCTCPEVRDAHASLWKGPGWTRKHRADLLKLMGAAYVYEHPARTRERLAASGSLRPSTPSGSGSSSP